MLNHVVFAMVVLLGASTAAASGRHRHARSKLVVQERAAPPSNLGAKVDSGVGAGFAVPPPVTVAPTFVEVHSARVENDLMLFQPTRVGLAPLGRSRSAELLATAPVKKEFRFFTPLEGADALDVRRDRDRLVLFRGPQPPGAALGIGLAMFGATTVLSAHAPRAIRVVFDGPVHLGPAIFDGGGMGAGIAGRGL